MKHPSIVFSMAFLLFSCFQVQAQHDHGSHSHEPNKVENKKPAVSVTDIFTVYGNCGMCEKRIEGALALFGGVHSADWDVETKVMTVKYDDSVIALDEIKKKVAAAGHDTDKFRAKDEVYNTLPGCCQYERPKN
jgi:periplasmic mercuric ion binding protein